MRQHLRHLLCFSLAVLLLIGWGAAFFFEDDRGERREHPIFPPAPYVIELPPAFYEEREEPAGRYAAIGEEMTDEERALSALMIYHEARGESEEGQRAVAEVLCNRILSELYPDTAKEVIYQQNQFSCADALTTAPVREPACLAKAFDILHEVLEETEYLLPETYLYFGTSLPANAKSYLQIGNHYFYEI